MLCFPECWKYIIWSVTWPFPWLSAAQRQTVGQSRPGCWNTFLLSVVTSALESGHSQLSSRHSPRIVHTETKVWNIKNVFSEQQWEVRCDKGRFIKRVWQSLDNSTQFSVQSTATTPHPTAEAQWIVTSGLGSAPPWPGTLPSHTSSSTWTEPSWTRSISTHRPSWRWQSYSRYLLLDIRYEGPLLLCFLTLLTLYCL